MCWVMIGCRKRYLGTLYFYTIVIDGITIIPCFKT